jgi:hypothetical protein
VRLDTHSDRDAASGGRETSDGSTADDGGEPPIPDTSFDASDASSDVRDDAGGPRPGFGTISGACGVLDTELQSARSHYVENQIDFGDDPYDAMDRDALTTGGREILDDGNAGGSSLYSEVFAYEILARCEAAELVKTETEITYERPNGTKTDLLTRIDGSKIGVSVTRAFAYPPDEPYPREEARRLLTDKLEDVRSSSANVTSTDAWRKQILHVVAYSARHEDEVEAVYRNLNATTKGETVVVVTVTDGMDDFLY